jgi:hypothetical protein
MNDRQRSQFDSSLAVRIVFSKEAYHSLWNGIPAFVLLHDRFPREDRPLHGIVIQGCDRNDVIKAKKEARIKPEATTSRSPASSPATPTLPATTTLNPKPTSPPITLRRLSDPEIDDMPRPSTTSAPLLAAPAPPAGTPAPGDAGLNAGKLDLLETYNLLLGSPPPPAAKKPPPPKTWTPPSRT